MVIIRLLAQNFFLHVRFNLLTWAEFLLHSREGDFFVWR
jgi:hypothetical protein